MPKHKRLQIYVSSLALGGHERFSVEIASSLRAEMLKRGWDTGLLGRAVNELGIPIPWSPNLLQAIAQTRPQSASESVYVNAHKADIDTLFAPGSTPFDVLYLPSPWKNIPLGLTDGIAAPLVVSIHDLEFECQDYGILTDQYRRDAAKLAKLATAFVFSSATIRDEAVKRYDIPPERTHVVYQAPSFTRSFTAETVRAKYDLPERYVFALQWLKPRKNGRLLVEALALQKEHGQASIPLVAAGYPFDDIIPQSIMQKRYQESCMAFSQNAGLDSGAIIDCGIVESDDIPALIAGATAVVVPSFSEAGLSYLLLDALQQGVPVLYSRIPVFTERLGDDNRFGLSFDPNDAEELAAQLNDVICNPDAAADRAMKAQAWISQRRLLDVAREYGDIFEAVSASPWLARPHQRKTPMVGREERMAWLINHTTLRDAELPMIRSLGIEVYTSKELPAGNEFRTASVDYSEDEHSTLPNWVLNRLNQHNFYEQGVPNEIAEILNGYFGTVVVTSYFPPLRDLVRNYRGRVIVRVFGREHPHNYSEYFTYMGQGNFWRYAWAIQKRFWFTPCYNSITPIEAKFLRDRALMLPLALPDRILRAEGHWIGTDNRIMFLCPRINTAPTYYGRFYQEFKQYFGHLPHIIPGHQPTPVDDPHVTGFVSDDQMQAWFRELRVMFYHSREPRHLHYHPLEAVAYGMPLIFMKGGLVEELMGSGEKPGGCDSFEEAEQKLRRILDGDEEFTKAVIDSQRGLLDAFLPTYVRDAWAKDFVGDIMHTARVQDVPPFADWKEVDPSRYGTQKDTAIIPNRKIGIFALTVPGGGVHKYITGLLDALTRQGEEHGWEFELTWGLPFMDTSLYPAPTWNGDPPASLRLFSLPIEQPSGDHEAPSWDSVPAPQAKQEATIGLIAPQVLPSKQFLKGTGYVVRWRASSFYLRYRAVRLVSEAFIISAQWTREAIAQETLHPKNTGLRQVMAQTRFGRRVLQTWINEWIDSSESEVTVTTVVPEVPTKVAIDDVVYLNDPPEFPGEPPLPEKISPPDREYLTLAQIKEMTERYDAVYFPNPFRLISPNINLDEVEELPVAITMFDLAHEFVESWGPNTDSVAREMILWSHLAKKIIFCSDFIRNEAIKRYQIPEEKTHVVYQPPMVMRRDRPTHDEVAVVRAKLGLPEGYLLNAGFQGTHKNNILIFEAMKILRWRKYSFPPLVIGGVDAKRLLLGNPIGEYLLALQTLIKESNLEHGKDFIVVDYISEEDLPAVYTGSTINISVSRSEAGLHGMVTESMLYQVPLIVSSIAQNTGELGHDDTYALIVPPDDAVALADAIQYTLDHPDKTAKRVQQASAFIRKRTWDGNGQEYLQILEQIAVDRQTSEGLEM